MNKPLTGKYKCCVCGNGYATKGEKEYCELRLKPDYGIGDIVIRIDSPSRKVRVTGFSTDHHSVYFTPEARGRLDKGVGKVDHYKLWEMPSDVRVIRGEEADDILQALREKPASHDTDRSLVLSSGRRPKPCPICGKQYFDVKERDAHRRHRWNPGFGFGDAVVHRNNKIVGVVQEIDHDHATMSVKVGEDTRKFYIWVEKGKSYWLNAATVAV